MCIIQRSTPDTNTKKKANVFRTSLANYVSMNAAPVRFHKMQKMQDSWPYKIYKTKKNRCYNYSSDNTIYSLVILLINHFAKTKTRHLSNEIILYHNRIYCTENNFGFHRVKENNTINFCNKLYVVKWDNVKLQKFYTAILVNTNLEWTGQGRDWVVLSFIYNHNQLFNTVYIFRVFLVCF